MDNIAKVKVKTVKVTNCKNVLIQLPTGIMENLGVQNGDTFSMYVTTDNKFIIEYNERKVVDTHV